MIEERKREINGWTEMEGIKRRKDETDVVTEEKYFAAQVRALIWKLIYAFANTQTLYLGIIITAVLVLCTKLV